MRKLWDIAWKFWKFRNHTLHATYDTRKLDIIELINKRVTCHLEKGGIGLPTWWQFLFHTSIHTVLTCPIRQILSWMASTASARQCFRPHSPRKIIPHTDKLIIGIITMEILIPTLSHIDKDPQLRTTIVPWPFLSLHIEREDQPNPLTQNDHNLSLAQAWDFR